MHIGLTGGIGSGKSTVAAWWQAQGLTLVDTDALARALTAPAGAALPAIAALFGADFVSATQGLRRERMRELVLRQPQAKRQLEALLHPMIQSAAEAQAKAAPGAVLFDVPLLVESAHWRARVDRVLLIDCTPDVQIARVAARPGWTQAQAAAVIALQASRERRRAAADACIDNSRITLSELHRHLQQLAWHWGLSAMEESTA